MERREVMRLGRSVIMNTMNRVRVDVEDLAWLFDKTVEFKWARQFAFETPAEAVMLRGPPQDRRQLGLDQVLKTQDQLEGWLQDIKAIESAIIEALDKVRADGTIYLRNL